MKYRPGSGRGVPTRRVTLGQVGKITPGEARKLAKVTLGAVEHGADPAAQKAADRKLETRARLREILRLKWEHVDSARGMLRLPDSKTGQKVIVLNAPAFEAR